MERHRLVFGTQKIEPMAAGKTANGGMADWQTQQVAGVGLRGITSLSYIEVEPTCEFESRFPHKSPSV